MCVNVICRWKGWMSRKNKHNKEENPYIVTSICHCTAQASYAPLNTSIQGPFSEKCSIHEIFVAFQYVYVCVSGRIANHCYLLVLSYKQGKANELPSHTYMNIACTSKDFSCFNPIHALLISWIYEYCSDYLDWNKDSICCIKTKIEFLTKKSPILAPTVCL